MRIPCDISLIAQSILTLVILERECQLSYCSEKIDFKALCSQWNFGLFSCVKGRPRMVIKTLSLQTGCIKFKIASICAINQGDQTVQQFSRLLHHYKDWGNVSLRAIGITLADKTVHQSAVIVTAPREANKPVFTPFFMVSIFVCFVEVF